MSMRERERYKGRKEREADSFMRMQDLKEKGKKELLAFLFCSFFLSLSFLLSSSSLLL